MGLFGIVLFGCSDVPAGRVIRKLVWQVLNVASNFNFIEREIMARLVLEF